jgi:hypothetical protein
MSADALGPNDPVLNYCLQHGTCTQVLQDLAFNLVANNQESRVTNPAFQKIIQLAKIDQPINPNVVAKIATSYGLPIDVAVDVLRGAKQGGISGEAARLPSSPRPWSPCPRRLKGPRPGPRPSRRL